MHMLPTSACSGAGIGEKSEARRTQVQNSSIGNGTHVPSVMFALIVLLQFSPAADALMPFSVPHCQQNRPYEVGFATPSLSPGL